MWQLQESICFAIKYFEWFCKRGLSHIICLTPKCQCKKCFLDVGPQLHSKRWLKYNCNRKNLALSSWLAILIVDCLDFLVIACWSYTLNLKNLLLSRIFTCPEHKSYVFVLIVDLILEKKLMLKKSDLVFFVCSVNG